MDWYLHKYEQKLKLSFCELINMDLGVGFTYVQGCIHICAQGGPRSTFSVVP